jgi:general secretion pathway protein G
MFRHRGFTLLELVTTVTIISILSMITIVKYIQLSRVTKEGATKANLIVLRSAIRIYYSDNDGQNPSNLGILITGRKQYIASIPGTEVPPYHPESAAENDGSAATAPTDAGGWAYINDDTDPNFGSLWVNCTHTDTKGTVWTNY